MVVGGAAGDDPLPGSVLEGRNGSYAIEAEHGRGGFGVTYRGRRRQDGATIIAKLLRLDRLGDWKTFELFEREAAVLRSLRHPGIPAWVDHFPLGSEAAPTGFALVQEFMPGPSLQQTLREGTVLAGEEMLAWFGEILAVLAYLHAQSPPVIHRDVTPKNVILRPDGRAALVDFGSVQAALRDAHTLSSTAAGTFGYAPVEQFIGRATPASDLYGLGMTYLAVASGREPRDMPVDGVRVAVRSLLHGDARLLALLEEMTELDPRHRLVDADEAGRRVAALRDGRPAALARVERAPASAHRRDITAVRDSESYAVLVAARLQQEGFAIERGGIMGDSRLQFSASRRGSLLGRHASFHVHLALADQLDEQGELSARSALAFVGAAGLHHGRTEVLDEVVAGASVVVPVVVTPGALPPGFGERIGALAAGEKVDCLIVPALASLGGSTVELVAPPALAGKDPEGCLPYLEWLLTPSRLLALPPAAPGPRRRAGGVTVAVASFAAAAGGSQLMVESPFGPLVGVGFVLLALALARVFIVR